jgi:hypothetical protein
MHHEQNLTDSSWGKALFCDLENLELITMIMFPRCAGLPSAPEHFSENEKNHFLL